VAFFNYLFKKTRKIGSVSKINQKIPHVEGKI